MLFAHLFLAAGRNLAGILYLFHHDLIYILLKFRLLLL